MPQLIEEYKVCPNCGYDSLPVEARFCSECGKKVVSELICDECGNSNAENSKFCINCGAKLMAWDIFTDPRDETTYKTIKIANKIWMAENLAYGGVEHYCPNDDRANVKEYGYLYTLEEAKKACPPGWRLPTKEEFEELLELIGADDDNSSPLRDESWEDGSNSSGFGALPAGFRNTSGYFVDFGSNAVFWSATPRGSDNAEILDVYSGKAEVNYCISSGFFSVRCLKD